MWEGTASHKEEYSMGTGSCSGYLPAYWPPAYLRGSACSKSATVRQPLDPVRFPASSYLDHTRGSHMGHHRGGLGLPATCDLLGKWELCQSDFLCLEFRPRAEKALLMSSGITEKQDHGTLLQWPPLRSNWAMGQPRKWRESWGGEGRWITARVIGRIVQKGAWDAQFCSASSWSPGTGAPWPCFLSTHFTWTRFWVR